jgi:hypothetical protein
MLASLWVEAVEDVGMRVVIGWARVLVLALGCSSCSYIFVSGKPANVEALPPSEPVECTTSKAAPVLDTVFGALEVARTGYALSLHDSDYSGQQLTRGAERNIDPKYPTP